MAATFHLFTRTANKLSKEMIDIVIPCSQEDARLLPLCVQGVRENVANGAGKIYVIAPQCREVVSVCDLLGLVFVDEMEFIGFGKEDLHLPSHARPAWIYQQLIKLKAHALPVSKDFLVIDADHILLRSHYFVLSNEYFFYVSNEYHKPYFDAIENLFGEGVRQAFRFSFISDKMIFNRDYVAEMLTEIESHCKCSWIEAIETKCPDEYNNFSEYETYGNWLIARKGRYDVTICDEKRFKARKYIHLEEANYKDLKREFGCYYESITQMKY